MMAIIAGTLGFVLFAAALLLVQVGFIAAFAVIAVVLALLIGIIVGVCHLVANCPGTFSERQPEVEG